MSEHTPGPWVSRPWYSVSGTWAAVVADSPDRGYVVAHCNDYHANDDENEANARLIAESPSLLGIAESLATALEYPRGSEAQVRCLEEIAQDAAAIVARIKGAAR